MRLLGQQAWVLVAFALLSGCAAFDGARTPQSTNEALTLGYTAVEQAYTSLELAVRNPTVELSQARAQGIHDRIRQAETLLDGARDGIRAGLDPGADVATRVSGILAEVQQTLRELGVQP